MLLEELKSSTCRFCGNQRVDHDPTGLTSYTPKFWLRRAIRCSDVWMLSKSVGVQKIKAPSVSCHMTGIGNNPHFGHLGDQTALLFIEILRVGKRQISAGFTQNGFGV